MSTGTGPGGNIWNLGGPTGPSNVWPGGGVWPGMQGSSAGNTGVAGVSGGSPNLFTGSPGGMHIPGLMAPPVDDGSSFGLGGINNGLSLAGAWASGGFNTQGSPTMSGWQQFSGTAPFGSPMSIPGATPMSGLGIGSVGVAGANPNQPFGATNTGIPGSSGFPGLPQVTGKDLSKIYGKGVGGALAGFLNSGAGFNPAVVQAQINQAMPIEARTTAKMMDIFGNTGNAYSSTAALGIGDFEAQFNAALQGQFANEYQQSVQNYLSVLMGVAPSAQQQQAQKGDWLTMAGDLATAIMGIFV